MRRSPSGEVVPRAALSVKAQRFFASVGKRSGRPQAMVSMAKEQAADGGVDRGEARRARRAGPAGASVVGRGRTEGKQRMRRSCGAICRIGMPRPTTDVVSIVLS